MKTAKSGQKRLMSVIAFLLITVLTLTVTVSCKKTGDVDEKGSATVVVAVGEDVRVYDVPLDKIEGQKGAIALLDYLKGEGKLDYTAEDGGYGPFLTSVGHLSAGGGVYVGIWTSVESDQDRESVYSTAVEYEGVTLYSSNVGMQELNVPSGAIIYFGEMRY